MTIWHDPEAKLRDVYPELDPEIHEHDLKDDEKDLFNAWESGEIGDEEYFGPKNTDFYGKPNRENKWRPETWSN